MPTVTLVIFLHSFLSYINAQTEIPLALHYTAFGPLPYTSSSRGIEPLKSIFPSQSYLSLLASVQSFPSESAVGGSASWRTCPYNRSARGVISCPFPDADHTQLYDVIAIANFTVHPPQTASHLVQCSDPAIITPLQIDQQFQHLVSNIPANAFTHCPDDPYEDGRSLCALRLYPGVYQVAVFTASSSNSSSFYCNYFIDPSQQQQHPSLLHPLSDSVTPNVIARRNPPSPPFATLAGPHCSVTIMNIHTSLWASKGLAELREAPTGLSLAAHSQADSHYPLPRIAPRQVRQLRIDFLTDHTFLEHHPEEETGYPDAVSITLAVTYDIEEGVKQEALFHLSFDVAVWRESTSYHFTYIDIDGSVQAAAVLPPKHSCIGAPAGEDACSVLLSTHGAGVGAVAKAWTESYRTQNQSWVLLPTGRRKFGLNWEGPQMISAITALRALSAHLPGVPTEEKQKWKARNDYWLQAGHSMGGHGALLLSTHFPDMIVGASPAMGWLRLSTLGSAEFAEQMSYTDAALRALLTVASAEYSADLYAENLLGIPFLARVGSDDDNVPPYNLRKFVRLLKENEFLAKMTPSVVTLREVPGKGHWFDGVVDDDKLQPFIAKHLNAASKPRLPKSFTILSMNPATTGSRGGLRILSLEVPFQLSRLRITRGHPVVGTWTVMTENIRRFRYQLVYGILDQPERLLIDSSHQPISIDIGSLQRRRKYMDFCASSTTNLSETEARGVVWRRCRDESSWGNERSKERGPDTSGPAAQVLEQRKLVVVFPEGDLELQDTAVSYANSLYIRGISVQVTTDSNVSVSQLSATGESNMVLLGGPNRNRMSRQLYADGYTADVSFVGDHFCVSSKCFSHAGTGIAFLSPGPRRTLLFYVAGTDRDGMVAAQSFLPHSPASNVPEWIVVSKTRGWGVKGLGGVVGLGYFDHSWKLEVRKSYPAEFAFDLKRSGVTCALGQEQAAYFRWSGFFLTVVNIAAILVILCFLRRRLSLNQPYRTVPNDQITERKGGIRRDVDEKETFLHNRGESPESKRKFNFPATVDN